MRMMRRMRSRSRSCSRRPFALREAPRMDALGATWFLSQEDRRRWVAHQFPGLLPPQAPGTKVVHHGTPAHSVLCCLAQQCACSEPLLVHYMQQPTHRCPCQSAVPSTQPVCQSADPWRLLAVRTARPSCPCGVRIPRPSSLDSGRTLPSPVKGPVERQSSDCSLRRGRVQMDLVLGRRRGHDRDDQMDRCQVLQRGHFQVLRTVHSQAHRTDRRHEAQRSPYFHDGSPCHQNHSAASAHYSSPG